MTVKLEIAYIPIILPNHDHVWPNHVHLTSLHHQIDQTFPLLVDKKIIARIMFAGEREGLGTRLIDRVQKFNTRLINECMGKKIKAKTRCNLKLYVADTTSNT